MSDDGQRVAYADVDDVIAAAAKAKEEQVESLSVEELEEVAEELDIPRDLVKPAIDEIRRRRAALLAQEQAAASRRALQMKVAGGVAAGLLAVSLVWGLVTRASVRDAWHEVEARRAQVANVVDRQRALEVRWADVPDGPDKLAELSGADNRIRVERKRYDQAVSAYHKETSGFMGGLARSLGDYPETVPMSSEVEAW